MRDNALAVSGLLVDKIGGPSVKPYQPPGYWDQLELPDARVYGRHRATTEYRRGLYTYWQRTFLHPSLLAFDAPVARGSASCERTLEHPAAGAGAAERSDLRRSGRVFAERIVVKAGGANVMRRIEWAFENALSRKPAPRKFDVLT